METTELAPQGEVRCATMVSSDGPRELLLRKLEELRYGGLTSKQKQAAGKDEKIFVKSFIELSWTCEGLSRDDLKQLSIEELRELGELLTPKVRTRRKWLFLIPVTWIIWLPVCLHDPPEGYDLVQSSLHYLFHLKKLKKYYGKDYFPSQAIYDLLRK